VGYPDWLPTLCGLQVAVVSGAIGAVAFRNILRLTRGPVSVTVLETPAAIVIALGIVVATQVIVSGLPDEATYEQLLDGGQVRVSAAGFYGPATFFSLILMGGLFWCLGLYHVAIRSNAGMRFDKRPDEPDAIGSLIAEDERR
jgi:hypothetical protein